MLFSRSSWRSLAALAALCLLPLGLACGGKSDAASSSTSYVTVSGTVTYVRKQLLFDASGKPTGLLEAETSTDKFQSLPLRGVSVRVFQATDETDGSGNTVTVWRVLGSTTTSSDGKYSTSVEAGKPTFVEVASSMAPVSGSGVRLVAGSVNDATPVGDRSFYFLRKNAGGATPAGDPTPGTALGADATVDFAIGLDACWWKAPLVNTITRTTTTVGGAPVTSWSPSAVAETVGTGSRVAAILDTAYTFGSIIGDPTPGYTLYLHYDAASTEAKSSFVEYDRTLYPHAFDGSALAYFGFVRSLAANDDAWDEGVLFPLFARNWLMSQHFTSLMPTTPLEDRSDLQDLRPDMALLEGYSQAIAAVLLKCPYLADTRSGALSYRDVRETERLGTDAYSAANISALAWRLNLYANGTLSGSAVTPVADTATGWASLTKGAISRFFTIALPKDSDSRVKDIASIYGQIARLQEAKVTGETVDLAAYFPDATLASLLHDFNLTWPRPTSSATLPDPAVPDAGYMADWGADPNSATKALPSFTLKMDGAHRNLLDQFPNFSKDEVHTARFTLSGDRNYRLTLQGLAAGVRVEVLVDGTEPAYIFEGSGSQDLRAVYGNSTTAVLHRIQFRLLSPDLSQAPQTLTVRLDP